MSLISKLASGTFICALLLAGCSSADPSPSPEPTKVESSAQGTAYPFELDNCGEKLVFDKAPEEVILLAEINAPILYDLDLLDRVIARAGSKNLGSAGKDLRAALDEIPAMATSEIAGGHYHISTESVLELDADMVITYFNGVEKEKLEEVGVKVYSPPSNCPDGRPGVANYDWVDEEIDKMAQLFNVAERAQPLKDKLDQELQNLTGADGGQQTAAGLFITPGSLDFYTYGAGSMAHPIMETNGLKNVYGDIEKRVFQLSVEDLLAKDPEWIVLMTLDATPDEARAAFAEITGVKELSAVRNGKVVHVPFALTDPPSTLSVAGAIELGQAMKEIA